MDYAGYLLSLLLLTTFTPPIAPSEPFASSLSSYELLSSSQFHFSHQENTNRKRRDDRHILSHLDTDLSKSKELKFTAHGRQFHLVLQPGSHLISSPDSSLNIQVRYSNGTNEKISDTFTANYYTGNLIGEDSSSALVYYDTQTLGKGQPVIFAKVQTKNETFYVEPMLNSSDGTERRYVVYKSDDVRTGLFSNGVFNQSYCHALHLNGDEGLSDRNENDDVPLKPKRQASRERVKNRCGLVLVADWTFYKNIGSSDKKMTALYMINIIGAVNKIFTTTTFQTDLARFDNYGFDIKEIIVHADASPHASSYNTGDVNNDSNSILELFGLEDWSKYCLAHLFTFRQFDDSVLGLAYVASPRKNSYGGMCSKTMNRQGRLFSPNTGLSSFRSTSERQSRLLQREAELVTSHELGHNWGSEHDPSNSRCTPVSDDGGYYIMYAYANQGYHDNNIRFSPCSTTSMSEVLRFKSEECFIEESMSFCGNQRVDDGEECDAGFHTRSGNDSCCDERCKLRPNAQCSDRDIGDGCCRNCQIAARGVVCFTSQAYTECYNSDSSCDGVDKSCPKQGVKPKDTPCASQDFGKCDAGGRCLSLCQQLDKQTMPCLCESLDTACMQCCKPPSGKCRPIHELTSSFNVTFLSNGRLCRQGTCVNKTCQVKVKDHINRFWTVIENISYNAVLEFMKRNIVATIILGSLAIWVPISCFVHFFVDKKNRAAQKDGMILNRKQASLVDVVNDAMNNQNESLLRSQLS